jgi:integrase
LLKHVFNLAIDWGIVNSNPAVRISLFREDNQIERYLTEPELARLMAVLTTDENRMVCAILQLLLATGARLGEALQARWEHVNVEKRLWKIPAQNSKSKRVRSVPLNDSAIAVLSQLETQEYLFVNRLTGLPYTTITKVWERIRLKANLSNLRIHDLRHQFASFLVNNGRSLYDVQMILGHSSPVVTQRYAHLSTKSLQEAANSASVQIQAAIGN